jgi:hypothetical protein
VLSQIIPEEIAYITAKVVLEDNERGFEVIYLVPG